MTPLGLVSTGLTLVAVDFRFNGFDLVPDLPGWIMCIVGFGRLTPRLARWEQARQLTFAYAAVELLLVLVGLGQVRLGPVASGSLSVLNSVLALALVVVMCTAYIQVLTEAPGSPGPQQQAGDRPHGHLREAYLIRRAFFAVGGVIALLTPIALATGSDIVRVAAVLLVVPMLATFVWLITLTYRLRNHPDLQAA